MVVPGCERSETCGAMGDRQIRMRWDGGIMAAMCGAGTGMAAQCVWSGRGFL